jgi:hypothetical protein
VLEADARVGGRVRVETFEGVPVVAGAGVGRFPRDAPLFGLARSLGVQLDFPGTPVEVRTVGGAPVRPAAVHAALARLRAAAEPLRAGTPEARRARASTTFGALMTAALGPRGAALLTRALGFSDFEAADALDTLDCYGLDDLAHGGSVACASTVAVPWRALLAALRASLGAGRVRLGCRVTRLRRSEADGGAAMWRVRCDVGGGRARELAARRVVLALPIEPLRALLAPLPLPATARDALRSVRSQPFARVYARLERRDGGPWTDLVAAPTVVAGDLQKVLPVAPERGVYMIAYADNARAERLRGVSRARLGALLASALGLAEAPRVAAARTFFWRAGTHFYAPLPAAFDDRAAMLAAARRPLGPGAGLVCVGEALATCDQGWTAGAIESVDAALAAPGFLLDA